MFFILYQTTNLVNNKVYVGIHQCTSLDDGYLGSGRNLKLAITKYGKENFTRTILKICSSYDELKAEERKIVTREFCNRRDVYNCELGGSGGKIFTPEMREKMSKSQKARTDNRKGKKLRPKTLKERNHLSNMMTGERNPMFGIDVSSRMTPEANAKRLEKISIANRKPKSQTKKYSEYSKSRFWIINETGKLCHCIDKNDPRLISGEFKRGRMWT